MFAEESFHISESALFEAQRDEINPDVRRMDEVLDGLMWALGHGADVFPVVTGTLRRARTDPYPGAPALRLWFTIDEREVTLLSIERVADDEG
ncbi:MAG: hypothetical protein ACKVT1_05595 [Dehalococcoidia bacterium]